MRTLFLSVSILALLSLVLWGWQRSRRNASPTPRASEGVDQDAGRSLAGSRLPAERRSAHELDGPERIALLRDAVGEPEFEWTKTALDPGKLVVQRDVVSASGVSAKELLDAAERAPHGSEEQAVLLLATAWAEPREDAVDARLVEFAVTLGEPLEAHDRAGLAATHALVLAGRGAALGDVAQTLAAKAWSTDQGAGVFPGFSSVRAILALGTAELDPNDSALAPGFTPERARFRVSDELWALAARRDPNTWAATILERAEAGDEHARAGLADLRDARYFDELARLLDAEWNDVAARCHGEAARGLVAMGTDSSLARVAEELSAAAPRRASALEALRSWRGTESWGGLLALGDRLRQDEEAHAAWRAGLERAWDRLRVRRQDDPTRQRALAALLASDDALVR